MEAVYFLGILLSEWIKYGLFLAGILGLKLRRYWIVAAEAAIVLGLIGLDILDMQGNILIFIFVILVAAGFFFQIEGNGKKRVLSLMGAVVVIPCLDEIMVFLVGILLKVQMEGGSFVDDVYLVSNVCVAIILLLVTMLRRVFPFEKIKMEKIRVGIYAMLIFSGIVQVAAISLLQYIATYVQNGRFSFAAQIMAVLSFLGIIFLGGIVYYIVCLNQKIRKNLETEQELKTMQKNYYELLIHKEADTRSFRHDVMNHLLCIHELGEQEKFQEMLKYIEDLRGEIEGISNRLYHTGNDIVDSILNYYLNLLKENTDVQVTGKLPNEIGISGMDLCTVVSNLLCNAVEELNSDEKKYGYLRAVFGNGKEYIKIQVENSCERYDIGTNRIPETVKKDKRNHGIGLNNINSLVEKKKGKMEIEYGDGRFMVMVILPKTTA